MAHMEETAGMELEAGAADATEAGLDEAARRRLLAVTRTSPCGLFTDVDGTISPIAPTPDAATLLPGVRESLMAAHERFAVVAAVSGRAADDAYRMVDAPGLLYIGNHGLEWLETQEAPDGVVHETRRIVPGIESAVAAIHEALEEIAREIMPRFPGLLIEPKGVTASIHVRQTGAPAAAEAAVLAALDASEAARGLRITHGKRVIELRPPVTVNKGSAISEVIRERGLQGAIYLGDDRTDIDAFLALRRLTAEGVCQGVSVAVLQEEAPTDLAEAADVTLESIERVPALLRWLLAQGTATR